MLDIKYEYIESNPLIHHATRNLIPWIESPLVYYEFNFDKLLVQSLFIQSIN